MSYVRYPEEQWREWIQDQQDSGLSVAEFCDAVGVSASTFSRWRAKLSEDQANVPPAFIPVSVVPSVAVEIELQCGAVIHVPRDEDLMRQVLAILLERDTDGTGAGS